mmetsp:Transcript_10436/g.27627  ORF Transcript_10436/g.27627 Transcript_10436/m.27627 type:complete len:237 (-) Transcript_10436:4-714(-)
MTRMSPRSTRPPSRPTTLRPCSTRARASTAGASTRPAPPRSTTPSRTTTTPSSCALCSSTRAARARWAPCRRAPRPTIRSFGRSTRRSTGSGTTCGWPPNLPTLTTSGRTTNRATATASVTSCRSRTCSAKARAASRRPTTTTWPSTTRATRSAPTCPTCSTTLTGTTARTPRAEGGGAERGRTRIGGRVWLSVGEGDVAGGGGAAGHDLAQYICQFRRLGPKLPTATAPWVHPMG